MKKKTKRFLAYLLFSAAMVLTGFKPPSVNADSLAKRPPGRTTVSILWFENRADADAEYWRYGLNGSMKVAMKQVKAIRLRSGVEYARRELGIEKGSALKAEQARRIGEIVEAQRVVWGSYQRSGKNWQVTVFLMNVASGEISEPITASGTDWFDLRDALVQQVLEQLRINLSEEEKEKMLRRETHSPQALEWRVKSHAYQADGKPLFLQEEASRRAIAADAQYAEAYVDLSAELASQGKLDEAEVCLRRAVKIKPDLASAHQVLGVIHLFKDQDKQALRELQEALRLDPENTGTLVRLSEFYASKEQWEQAVTYAKETIALAPLDASLHAHLGWIYVNRHQRDLAMRELKEAERLADPDVSGDLNSVQKIGQSYRLLGEIPLAVKHYERLVAQARATGANPEYIGQFDKTLQHMKATLTPTFVEAEIPRTYTEQTLHKALQEKLSPAELALVVNPIAGNPEISRWAGQLTAGTTNEIDKARAIFEELIQRIQLEGGHGKRTAREVCAAWNDPDQVFCCQEFAKLYLVLAREVGIKAFYVHLGRDYRGKLVFHDCAIIFVGDKALLVDPAYRWFGVPHQEFTVLNDVQTVAHQLFQHTPGARSVARCRAATKLHPDFAWGQVCLASALVNDGQLSEAANVLENAERLERGRWDVHQLKGTIAAKGEDWDAAKAHFNKALELNPGDAETHFLLAATLAAQGKEEEAREAYRTCLRNRPRDRVADEARRAIVQINENIGVESGEELGTAALMVAIEKGNIETIRQMLTAGADANARETSGTTPLLIAALRGHTDLVDLLLEAGAKVDAAEESAGVTPLFVAVEQDHDDIVRRLIAAGADVDIARTGQGMTPLITASQNGFVDVVKLLLEADADVDAAEKTEGGTALFVAALNSHTEVVKLLLATDADVNATLHSNGATALHIAAEKGHIDVVKQLLAAHAEVNATLNDNGPTALYLAAKNDHTEVINLLRAANAKVVACCPDQETAVLIASERGDTGVVKLLLASTGDINVMLDKHGAGALFMAAQNGHVNVVKQLLKAGADVNTVDKHIDGTPLYIASQNGHAEVVKVLLATHADPHPTINKGSTPIMAAADQGHAEVIELLLSAQVDVNTQRSRDGVTALFLAAHNGHADAVELLLKAGAKVNTPETTAGITALYTASQQGHVEVVKQLLAAGANVHAVEKTDGGTPLFPASERGHVAVVKLLLGAEAEVNTTNLKGMTPLHLAALNGETATVRLLLAAGADVDAAEKTMGATPLFIASQNGHADVVRLLLANKADVNSTLKYKGYTPLFMAVAQNRAKVVKLLLDAGADMNAKGIVSDGQAYTPLEIARKLEHDKIVELLESMQKKEGTMQKSSTKTTGPHATASCRGLPAMARHRPIDEKADGKP